MCNLLGCTTRVISSAGEGTVDVCLQLIISGDVCVCVCVWDDRDDDDDDVCDVVVAMG